MIPIPSTQQLDNWGPFLMVDDFLSSRECMLIEQEMTSDRLVDGEVSEGGGKNLSIRKTKVCGLDYNEKNLWFFNKLIGCVNQINSEVYKMDIQGFHEAIQLLRYEVGGHYDWHQDSGNLQFSRRKLSVSIQLTDHNRYEGGELEFFRNGTAVRDKGALILFPSYMHHRVLPVTKGSRNAIVAWVSGNPYR